ncbi:MAG: ribonuclease P [Candidatus Bathyarchaeota archaeon]|nr:ribonuclease P [Candidatus Termiticorpusculum sp.]
MKGSIKQLSVKQIANQRVDILFAQAEIVGRSNPELARSYVKAAKKVAMSARFSLPSKYKRRVCRRCSSLFIVGFNCRTRIQQKREPHVVVTCLNCGYLSRMLFKKKRGCTKVE